MTAVSIVGVAGAAVAVNVAVTVRLLLMVTMQSSAATMSQPAQFESTELPEGVAVMVRIVLRPGVEPEPIIADLGADTPTVHHEQVHLGRIEGSVLLEATLRAAPRHRCRETTDRVARRPDVYQLEVTAKA